jgi:hypothetical protein
MGISHHKFCGSEFVATRLMEFNIIFQYTYIYLQTMLQSKHPWGLNSNMRWTEQENILPTLWCEPEFLVQATSALTKSAKPQLIPGKIFGNWYPEDN